MRSVEERETEDTDIVRGLRDGKLDLRAQRAQRAVRAMHRREREASSYSDPWIEQEEEVAVRVPRPPSRPGSAASPKKPSKPILTERQMNVVMETLFGQAAPAAQTVLDMASSDTGKKVVAVGGLALGSMLLPLVGGIRR
jgi:hypothetical protein